MPKRTFNILINNHSVNPSEVTTLFSQQEKHIQGHLINLNISELCKWPKLSFTKETAQQTAHR